MKNTNPKSVGS